MVKKIVSFQRRRKARNRHAELKPKYIGTDKGNRCSALEHNAMLLTALLMLPLKYPNSANSLPHRADGYGSHHCKGNDRLLIYKVSKSVIELIIKHEYQYLVSVLLIYISNRVCLLSSKTILYSSYFVTKY